MRHLNSWYPYQKPSKNKSSKNNSLIMGRKNAMRYVSNAQLKEWENHDVPMALAETERRKRRNARKSEKANG